MAKNDFVKSAGVAIATAALASLPKVISIVSDKISDKIDENKNLIEMPEIISSKGHMSLVEAKKLFDKKEIVVGESEAHPNKKYKDCSDFDVVDISHRKKWVRPGTSITLYYVTPNVIEESKHLYAEYEKQMYEKMQMKIKQKEINKQKLNDAAESVQKGIVVATSKAGMQIKKIVLRRKKTDQQENSNDGSENNFENSN